MMVFSVAPGPEVDDLTAADGTLSPVEPAVPAAWSAQVPGVARVTVRRPGPKSASIVVTGEIDVLTVGPLEQCLLAAVGLPDCRTLLVDLGRVRFLGAVGIEAFARARASGVDVTMHLVSASRAARLTLGATGAAGWFETGPDASGPGTHR